MEQMLQDIAAFARSDLVAEVVMAVAILAVTALVSRVAKRFMRGLLHLSDGRDLPSSSIFVNIVRAAVWILGVCVMLSTCFGVDVSAAITALGVGGIALSLGFQDTISNLIGGLQVSILRIVAPGDNIEVGGTSGVVTDVTWRHTTIRTGAGEDVIVPNSVMNKNALTQLPPATQVRLPVVVESDCADLDQAAGAIERAAAEGAGRVATLTCEPRLAFSALEASGLKGTIAFEVADAADAPAAADAALRAVAPVARAAEGGTR